MGCRGGRYVGGAGSAPEGSVDRARTCMVSGVREYLCARRSSESESRTRWSHPCCAQFLPRADIGLLPTGASLGLRSEWRLKSHHPAYNCVYLALALGTTANLSRPEHALREAGPVRPALQHAAISLRRPRPIAGAQGWIARPSPSPAETLRPAGPLTKRTFWLAGAGGFEPPYDGIKIRCLTAWRRPIRRRACIGRVPGAGKVRSAALQGAAPAPPAGLLHLRGGTRGDRRASANRPKQVAPEPLMRASRQPGVAANAASTSPITGCSAIGGRLQVVAQLPQVGRHRRGIRPACRQCRRRRPGAAARAEHIGGCHRRRRD